ncbi:hypothetical protein ACI79F_10990 [Blastococcus sp. SYSU D00868]
MPCPSCTPRGRCAACARTAATAIVRVRSSWTRTARGAAPR